MDHKDLESIRIRADLYQELRDYCDRNGMRFRSFVEDALESAPHQEDLAQMADEVTASLEKLDAGRRKSFRRGFWQGYCAALYAFQGKLGMSLDLTPSYLRAEDEVYKVAGNSKL